MSPKIPTLDTSNKEAINSWNCDMQDLQNDVEDALAKQLDTHGDAASLVGALQEVLAPYNQGEDDQLLVKEIHGAIDVENCNSGDGCTIIRQGDKWWLKSTERVDYGSPSSPERQHAEVAGQMIYFMWWGNLEDVQQITGNALGKLAES